MRRNREKKQGIFNKRNMMGLLIVAVMILSVLGFMSNDQTTEDSESYKGHDFVRNGDYWYTDFDGKQLRVRYHPSVVDGINISEDAVNALNDSLMVYLSFNPEDKNIQAIEQIRMEMEKDMQNVFKTYVVTGVINTSGNYGSFKTISCENATSAVPVIYFETAKDDIIEYVNNCIIVKARTANDLMIMKDRLILGISGIVTNTPENTSVSN